MQNQASGKYNAFFYYIITIILTCAILTWMLYAPGFDIHLPLGFKGDELFSSLMVKSIIETGWFWHNPAIGAPGISNVADYPMSEGATFLLMRFFSLFSQNYAVVLNCFYFLTYPLTAVFSLYVFRKLDLKPIFAIVASLLFTFVPYHYLRGEAHLYLTALYVIPIYVLLMLSVFYESRTISSKKNWLPILLQILAVIFAASSGVYYAFFACYLLLITGIAAAISQEKIFPYFKASVFIAGICVVLAINTLPYQIEHHKHGLNTEIATRNPKESEVIGLKISQLLLPIVDHRIHPFRLLREKYDRTAPIVNENGMASIGLIGGIGFILLLIVLFARERIQATQLYLISRLNLAILLLGTVGGFSALFSYIISPMIRSYNRVSVFVAFFAFFSFFYFLQKITAYFKFKNITLFLLLGVLLCLGISDQVWRHHAPDYQVLKATWQSDQAFVNKIEENMPKGAMIFQLPAMRFPESKPFFEMSDYQLSRGYLHSHSLRWSYGAIRGRAVDHWQQDVSNLPLREMLNKLAYAGFSGVFIDTQGFEDHGKKIEAELVSLLKQQPLLSEDGTFLFFDLREYNQKLQHSMSSTEWRHQVENTVLSYQISKTWIDGFYPEEKEGNKVWHWGKAQSALQLVNMLDHPVVLHLHFIFKTSVPQASKLVLNGLGMQETLSVSNQPTSFDKKVTLLPGENLITFKSNAPMAGEGSQHPKAVMGVSLEV